MSDPHAGLRARLLLASNAIHIAVEQPVADEVSALLREAIAAFATPATAPEGLEKPEPDSRDWWRAVAQGLGVRLFTANAELAALRARSALSDETLREMADEWAGKWDSTVKDVMLNFARAVLARHEADRPAAAPAPEGPPTVCQHDYDGFGPWGIRCRKCGIGTDRAAAAPAPEGLARPTCDEVLRAVAASHFPHNTGPTLDKLVAFARVVLARQFDCAVHAIAAITEPDPKLLTIAGLVNTYHNDSSTLSAAETLRAIADVLGDPFALVRQQEGS